jgi:hypothetical protein
MTMDNDATLEQPMLSIAQRVENGCVMHILHELIGRGSKRPRMRNSRIFWDMRPLPPELEHYVDSIANLGISRPAGRVSRWADRLN